MRPAFRLLDEAQLDALHLAAVEILADPGIRVTTEEARALLVDGGANPSEGDVFRLPARLVDDALASVPHAFPVFGRDGAERLRLGEGNVYFGSGVTALEYLEPGAPEPRNFTVDDVAAATRLTDALPNLDFMTTPGVVRPSDEMRVELANQHEFVAMVSNTTKPLMVLIADGRSLQDVLAMAEIVAGGRDALRERPFVMPYLNSVSPLLFNPETLDKLLLAADRGLPVCCQAAPVMGATAPVTLAGAIAIAAAETLAGLVLAQLKRPGTPFITGTVPFGMEMWKGNVSNGGPTSVRFMVAMCELARRWGLPLVGVSAGGDSKLPDEQAAVDLTYYGFGAVLGGVDLVFDAGNIEGGLQYSPEVATMADEVVGMLRGVLEPVDVSDTMLALDTIRSVGIGGTYLGEPHTLSNFRSLWMPNLLSWHARDDWAAAGSTTLRQRAAARATDLIETHEPDPLPPGMVDAFEGVIRAREATLAAPE
jgi:trimethylamine---corrinoid protein Co-methyltransferase